MSVSTIIEIFEDILDVKKGSVSIKTTPSDFDEWDSVATVNVIVALEDEFDIKFQLKDIERANTVQDFVNLIETYKK